MCYIESISFVLDVLHIAVHAVAFQSYNRLQQWLYIQISATFTETLFPSAFSITDKNYKVTGWHNLVNY